MRPLRPQKLFGPSPGIESYLSTLYSSLGYEITLGELPVGQTGHKISIFVSYKVDYMTDKVTTPYSKQDESN
jgi:hypothetical protein